MSNETIKIYKYNKEYKYNIIKNINNSEIMINRKICEFAF